MSRDRDDRSSSRSRDRDDDRGSSRGRDRDEDRGGSRGRDRDDDRGSERGRGSDRGRGGGRDERPARGPKGGGSNRRGGHRSAENVRKRSEQTAGNFDTIFKSGVEQWFPKVGENCIRVLPPTWENAEHYGYDVFVHAFIGSSGSTYICPAKTFDKPCAACDEAKELKAAGEEEEAKKMAVKKKSVMYVIDRDDRKPWPKVCVISWNQDKEIADASTIKKTNTTLYIDDENSGWDLYVKRTGKNLNTRYTYVVDRDESPIDADPDMQDDILAFIDENPIPDLLRYVDNETIAKSLDGGTRERDRELDDDDDKRGGRGGRGRDRDDDGDDDRGSVRRGGGRGRDADDGDDRPARGRGRDRGDDGDEEDTRSPRGDRMRSGRDEERPARGGRERDDNDGEDDRRSRGRDEEEPRGRNREPERGGRDRDRDEDRPRSRREPEDDDRPSRRGRDREEDDERPRRR